jgi:hypothetical protein
MGLLDGGVGDLLGGLVGGGLSMIGAQQQNTAASNAADKQMAFQQNMSNTAHQREVTDLKAAGLNPILSGMGGSGASTPMGAMAPVQNTMSGLGQSIVNSSSSAAAAKRNRDAIDSQTNKNNTDNILTNAQKILTDTKNQQATHDARSAKANANVDEINAQIRQAQLPAELKWAPWKPAIDAVGKLTGTATEALGGGYLMKKLLQGVPGAGPGMGQLKDGTKFNLDTGLIPGKP